MKYIIILLSIFILTGCTKTEEKKEETPEPVAQEEQKEKKTVKDIKLDNQTYFIVTNNSDDIIDVQLVVTLFDEYDEDIRTRNYEIDTLKPLETRIIKSRIKDDYARLYIIDEIYYPDVTLKQSALTYTSRKIRNGVQIRVKNNAYFDYKLFDYTIVLYEDFEIKEIIFKSNFIHPRKTEILNTYTENNFDDYSLFVE